MEWHIALRRQCLASPAHNMATLVTRPGDPQALKAVAAAGLAGTALSVVALEDTGAWKKLLTDASAPFGQPQLFLVLPDGSAIGEANAIARCLGAVGRQLACLACTGAGARAPG